MSTALSSNMLYVYACTKSLLCLSWYADGMGCDGKGPKHVHGLFLIACLSLNWYPGANKQLVLLFWNGTCWETEKKSTRHEGKEMGLSRTFFRTFSIPTHGFSYSFLNLLWCKQGCSICCFPPYPVSFPYNSHILFPVKNADHDQNQQKFLQFASVGFRWALCWATRVPFCLWSRPRAFRKKKINTHRTRLLDI